MCAAVRKITRAIDEVRFQLGCNVPVTVLMYHSVHPHGKMDWGPWRYAVTPKTFEEQLSAITERYEVRPLEDIVTACRDGNPPSRPTTAITFDDGFRDNLTKALPLLKQYDAPATVYVAGKYLNGQAPFEYRLASALQSASQVSINVGESRIEQTLTDEQSRRTAYEEIYHELKFARSGTREAAVDAIDSGTVPSMLTNAELTELADDPLIDIGAHGYEHVPLTMLDETELRSNLEKVKSMLESVLNHPVTQFSYPYGDHSNAVARVVEDVGFETAVTTVARRLPAARFGASPYRIPRYDGSEYR